MTLLDEVLRTIDSLPPLPAAILELAKVVESPFPSVEEVTSIVERDPALAAATLRVANSAAVGTAHQVSDVGRAVSQIGPRAAIEVAMSAAFTGYLPRRLHGYEITREAFVEHCVTVGRLANAICQQVHLRMPGDAFTCGLLHDCGKLVLCHFIDMKRANIPIVDTTGSRWVDAERALLGTDHTVLGEALARAWDLPDLYRVAARWHHSPWQAPPRELPEISAALHLANEQAHKLAGEEDRDVSPDAAAILQLDEQMLAHVLAEATRRLSEPRRSSAA